MVKYRFSGKLLVLLHIILFVSPLIVKGLHVHEHNQGITLQTGLNIDKNGKDCLVCNYEFVTYEEPLNYDYPVNLPFFESVKQFIPSSDYNSQIYILSNRAPPVM
jgi:hypothetical protein